MPCGFGGDQVDLLRRMRGIGLSEAIVELDLIADELPAHVRRQRRAPRDPENDMRNLHAEVQSAMDRAMEPEMSGYLSVASAFVESDDPLAPAWDAFLRGLGWGVDDLGRVVVPHWDPGGVLTGAKLRSLDGSKKAIPGSTFRHLYPAWQPQLHDTVVLTEGETDAAWAMIQAHRVDVRSVPRGAPGLADPPTSDDEALVTSLRGWRHVKLAFDGDTAGELATDRWTAALTGHPHVRQIYVPEGHDLRSAGRSLDEMLS
jgi:hypothetical protein